MSSMKIHSNNVTTSKNRRRGRRLIGLVCVSLYASTATGFVNSVPPSRQPSVVTTPSSATTMSAISSVELSMEGNEYGNGMGMGMHPSKTKSLAANHNHNHHNHHHNHNRKRRTKTVSDRLTPREETELLRRAVEYRRIHQLEKDLALMHHNFLPMLGVRAEAAGYGERLDDYEEAKYRGQLARETLVTSNMGLVRYCVNQIIGKETAAELKGGFGGGRSGGGLPLNSLSREDLLQEGAIGLARAVDKWNPEIGGKFSTYAVYWIRAAVLRCIAERDELVRVPSHVSQAITKINKAAKRLGWVLHESGGILVTTEGGGDGGSSGGSSKSVLLLPQTQTQTQTPPMPGSSHSNPRWRAASAAKQLAEEAGLSEKHFEEAMTARRRRYTGGYVSVESWMHPGGSSSRSRSTGGATALPRHYSDENEDHDRRRMEEAVANEDLRSVLSKHLRPKEMEALSWRYGLYDEDEQEELRLQQQQQQQQQRNLAGQSIKERANRQLLELEDQLFGPSAVAAANTAPAAKSKVQRVRPVKASASTSTSTSTLTSRATAKPSMAKPGRFGEAMTFTEVGKKMQVSAEYTRRLCHKALGKLQQAAEDGTLEPALLF